MFNKRTFFHGIISAFQLSLSFSSSLYSCSILFIPRRHFVGNNHMQWNAFIKNLSQRIWRCVIFRSSITAGHKECAYMHIWVKKPFSPHEIPNQNSFKENWKAIEREMRWVTKKKDYYIPLKIPHERNY